MPHQWYSTYNNTDGTDVLDKLVEHGVVSKKAAAPIRKSILEVHTKVGRLKCEYCGKEVLSVFDDFNRKQWWGYLGNQARRPGVYAYSPMVKLLRMADGCMDGVWNNNLYNVHARVHSKPVRDYSIICLPNSLHMLCNSCFQQTYHRVKVLQKPGQHVWSPKVSHVEISVLQSRGETVESVLRDLTLDPDKFVWW